MYYMYPTSGKCAQLTGGYDWLISMQLSTRYWSQCVFEILAGYLVGGLDYFSIYWEQSSHLTFIFFRGVGITPTS